MAKQINKATTASKAKQAAAGASKLLPHQVAAQQAIAANPAIALNPPAGPGVAAVAIALAKEVAAATPVAVPVVKDEAHLVKKDAKAEKAPAKAARKASKAEMKKAASTHAKAVKKGAKAPKALKTPRCKSTDPVPFPTSQATGVMGKQEMKQNALKRITKPGAIVIMAGHGLIRVKEYAAPNVTGVTVLHKLVTAHFDNVAPATKKQVDQYREEFKKQAKLLPTPIVVGTAVARKATPKAKIGYVYAVLPLEDTDVIHLDVALSDGSDDSVTYNANDLVAWTGKEPRFDDIPLFGAFISKGRPHVKVSKSNGVQAIIGGLTNAPTAVLATATAKLHGSAFKRFKKDDRVVTWMAGHPLLGLGQ